VLGLLRQVEGNDPDHEFDANAFNATGSQLLRKGQLVEAVRVFELVGETFPGAANAYDRLAEAYMRQGRTELAITNYKRSLELDPKNENAVTMLKELQQK
jgi:Flp pilus assembly protein TadD